jgi:hypothetical protein
MENISFQSSIRASNGDNYDKYFDPANKNNYKRDAKVHFVCCCGYELIKESETTWRCSGGSHRYNMQAGDVVKDKFGNFLFKVPLGMQKPSGAE